MVKDPPFQVSESGYGSFNLPVEVYFRNKDEPKKVKFDYDLLLPNLNDPPINQIRSECLTFQNPSEEFRQKLLKAGGVVSNGPPMPLNDKPKTPLPPAPAPTPSNNLAPSAASIANVAPPTLPPAVSKLKRSGSSLEGESAPKKKKKTEGKMKEKKKRTNSSSSESSESESSSEASNSANEEETMVTKLPKNTKKSSPNNWDTPSLKRLHKQLNSLQDPQQLQEIVNIIEQTGLYNLTASTFDFDLCKLDDQTLSKLSKFVEPSPSSTSSF